MKGISEMTQFIRIVLLPVVPLLLSACMYQQGEVGVSLFLFGIFLICLRLSYSDS